MGGVGELNPRTLGAVWEGDQEALNWMFEQRGPSGPPSVCVVFLFLFPLKHFTLKGSQAQGREWGKTVHNQNAFEPGMRALRSSPVSGQGLAGG